MKHRLALFCLWSTLALAQRTPASLASQAAHIERVERSAATIALESGQEPRQFALLELMKLLDVPGLSIAVFDDYQILWAKGYGVTESGNGKPVTTHTLFQAGDISQGVAAAGALALVEQGKLALDKNVNDQLHSWKLPDNEFTVTEKVTLRRLLSHTAGLTALDLTGYAPADAEARTKAEPVPTIRQVLDGERPANTAPVRVEMVPGAKFQYSNGDVAVEQLVLADSLGKPFPQAMHDLVLRKVGMTESTFEQPLPHARIALAAVGTNLDGTSVAGKRRTYPEMAALGLWTTPSDLARFAIEIAKSAKGRSNKILSRKMAQLMLEPQLDGRPRCIGFFLNDRNHLAAFSADGGTQGFQTIFMASSDTGSGFVIMANSDHGIDVGSYLVPAILREYGWTFPAPRVQAETILRAIASARNINAALDWFRDLKTSGSTEIGYGSYTLNRFGSSLLHKRDVSNAIKAFKLNTELFPQASPAYELLGEAYMTASQKDLAIQSYQKSLELNPQNDNVIQVLKRLKQQ